MKRSREEILKELEYWETLFRAMRWWDYDSKDAINWKLRALREELDELDRKST